MSVELSYIVLIVFVCVSSSSYLLKDFIIYYIEFLKKIVRIVPRNTTFPAECQSMSGTPSFLQN